MENILVIVIAVTCKDQQKQWLKRSVSGLDLEEEKQVVNCSFSQDILLLLI